MTIMMCRHDWRVCWICSNNDIHHKKLNSMDSLTRHCGWHIRYMHLFAIFDEEHRLTFQHESSTLVKLLSFKVLNQHGSQCQSLSEITVWKQIDCAKAFNAIQSSNSRNPQTVNILSPNCHPNRRLTGHVTSHEQSQKRSILKLMKTFWQRRKTEEWKSSVRIKTVNDCHTQLFASFDFVMISISTDFMQLKLYVSVYHHQVSWNATLSICANLDHDWTLTENNFQFIWKRTNFINLPLTSNDRTAIFKNHSKYLQKIADWSQTIFLPTTAIFVEL
jgi:hypothetical protein